MTSYNVTNHFMKFKENEIKFAKRLRKQGLQWGPKTGHYVYDETGFCKQPSPFQEKSTLFSTTIIS